jgi:hypothetical protein
MLYIAALLAFATAVTATPVPAALCPTGLYSNPQCCATDVLGAVGLNCAVRKSSHPFHRCTHVANEKLQPRLPKPTLMISSRLAPAAVSKPSAVLFLWPARMSCARMSSLRTGRNLHRRHQEVYYSSASSCFTVLSDYSF